MLLAILSLFFRLADIYMYQIYSIKSFSYSCDVFINFYLVFFVMLSVQCFVADVRKSKAFGAIQAACTFLEFFILKIRN